MTTLRLVVPGRPVPKGRPRVVHGDTGSRTFTPARTKEWEELARWYAVAAKTRPLDGDVRLTINVYLKPKQTGDGDNFLKAAADAMIGFMYSDDRQIREWHCYMHRDPDNMRTEIEVESLL